MGTSEKFTFLDSKATNVLSSLFLGYVKEATDAKDSNKIESELIPEIERLRLDIMDNVNSSLSKIYSGVLDSYIEAKDEEKIKTEFIPKVNSLGLDSEAKRAQEFLDEQEQLRKEEEERKR